MLQYPHSLVPSSSSIPDRESVLALLAQRGPSTVTELMRAAGPEKGARRKYRQLLRVMLRDGTVVLDKKGKMSVPDESEGDGRAGRSHRGRGAAASDAPEGRSFEKKVSRRKESGEASVPVARFEGHRDGFGFVNPTDGTRDVFIPPHKTGGALHGDLVEYKVVGTHPSGRRQGTVVRIARATGQRVVGLITRTIPAIEVVPFDARSGSRFTLTGHRSVPAPLAEGVAVEIELPRSGAGRAGAAKLIEVIGPITQPGVDLEVLLRKHHLRAPFPAQVLEEAEGIETDIPQAELRSREDFSGDWVVTIDGDTAKDFDDAVSVTHAPRGGLELAVHIADVAHYVRPGSAIDIEARLRGTSVYFPGRAIPMLPPALSEEVCSLKPEVPRLVQSAIMTFDRTGQLTSTRFADGWIRSRARLTYGRVNALLKGAPAAEMERPLLGCLELMSELATRLAARRADRGGLDFDLPEPEVVLDALGAAADVRPASRGPAQRMIEEFMIAANMAVAHELVIRHQPALHRVHERPDPAKVEDFARIVASFGYDFSVDPQSVEPGDFRRFLDGLSGRPEERILGRLLLRTMALARYSPEPLGHFGLAAPDYLHFTSPIRRYPDLIAHRALRHLRRVMEDDGTAGAAAVEEEASRRSRGGKGRDDRRSVARASRRSVAGRARTHDAEAGSGGRRGAAALRGAKASRRARHGEEAALAGEDLDLLGAECSRLERQAEAAERESLAWKRAEVLQGRVGDEMMGTISSIVSLGLFVELEDVYAEGLIPVSALPPDRYVTDGIGLSLRGLTTSRIYRVGQPVKIIVARVDRITQRVELALPGSPGGGVSAMPSRSAEYAKRARSRGDEGWSGRKGPRRGRSRGRT